MLEHLLLMAVSQVTTSGPLNSLGEIEGCLIQLSDQCNKQKMVQTRDSIGRLGQLFHISLKETKSLGQIQGLKDSSDPEYAQ